MKTVEAAKNTNAFDALEVEISGGRLVHVLPCEPSDTADALKLAAQLREIPTEAYKKIVANSGKPEVIQKAIEAGDEWPLDAMGAARDSEILLLAYSWADERLVFDTDLSPLDNGLTLGDKEAMRTMLESLRYELNGRLSRRIFSAHDMNACLEAIRGNPQ